MTVVFFAVGGAVTRAVIPALCADLVARIATGTGDIVCDVAGVTRPDVATVEALARLSLTARRHGRRMVVTGAGPDLRRLIGLLGLTDVLDR
jgi:anti-anti-sigma regulatory factor